MVSDALSPRPDRRRSRRYPFRVAGKEYHLQFLPMTYLDDYDEEDLGRLATADAWEVTFMLEDFVLPDSTVTGGYGILGTGQNFQVLGGVANGILDWAEKHRPQYLYWYAQGSRRQHLYERMISYLAARGSPWRGRKWTQLRGCSASPRRSGWRDRDDGSRDFPACPMPRAESSLMNRFRARLPAARHFCPTPRRPRGHLNATHVDVQEQG